MVRRTAWLALVSALVLQSGCSALLGLIGSRDLTVEFFNNTGSTVDVVAYYGNDQNVLEAVLTEFGTRLEYSIPAGQTQVFRRNCDDLQAIIIDDADLRLIGSLGPSADTRVFRDGDDFGCGDTIRFTFNSNGLNLNINFSTR